jgi:hypothetical protein
LDLFLFGIFKTGKQTVQPQLPQITIEGQTVLPEKTSEKVATSPDIRCSFTQSGIVLDVASTPYNMRSKEEQSRLFPQFQDLWDESRPRTMIASRGQQSKVGIGNDEQVNTMTRRRCELAERNSGEAHENQKIIGNRIELNISEPKQYLESYSSTDEVPGKI